MKEWKHRHFSYVENSLVVTGKDMKRTLRENPRKAEIDEILEIKRLAAWRTCKRAKSQMREPGSPPHPQHLQP